MHKDKRARGTKIHVEHYKIKCSYIYTFIIEVPPFRRLVLNGFMMQKTRAPSSIPRRFPGPSLRNAGARNTLVSGARWWTTNACCLTCLPMMKSVAAPDDGSFPRRYETNRRAGTPGPGPRRCRSAMCCAQLDALQVEKRIGVSGSRARIWRAEPLRGVRHGGVHTYSFLLLAVPLPNIRPFAAPCPFIFTSIYVTSATRSRDARKLTWFRV